MAQCLLSSFPTWFQSPGHTWQKKSLLQVVLWPTHMCHLLNFMYVCVCMVAHMMAHMWRSKDKLGKLVLTFHCGIRGWHSRWERTAALMSHGSESGSEHANECRWPPTGQIPLLDSHFHLLLCSRSFQKEMESHLLGERCCLVQICKACQILFHSFLIASLFSTHVCDGHWWEVLMRVLSHPLSTYNPGRQEFLLSMSYWREAKGRGGDMSNLSQSHEGA